MSRKCAKCGVVSEIEETFPKSYYSDKIFYCPTCWEKNAVQRGESFLIACVIVLIGGLAWVTVSPQNEFTWLVFQAGLLMCFILILALPHELGHTLAAFMTKAKIFQVTIGLGRVLYNHDFWGIEWIFRAIPFCGYTLIGFNNRKLYRLRSFLVTLGGPLANCFLIFAAVILLFHISSPWLLAVTRSFIAANVFVLLFSSLLPRKVNFAGIITPSDGLTLLTVPFMSELKINQEIEANYVWEVYSYYMKGRVEDARQSYEKGMAYFPDSPAIKNEMGKMFLYLGKYIEARNLFVQLQKSTNLSPVMKNGILNAIATADVMMGGNGLLEEADAFSKTACENMPWQTEFKGTRGLVLVKKGHIEQGLTLLKEAMGKTENSSHKAVYASYIAEFENKKWE
jgi:fumarate reductase subunit C